MVIDTSALIAILEDEPERAAFNAAVHDLLVYLTRATIEIVPVTSEQALLAADAYRRYGKRRHRASLSYGDVFSYALARDADEPLLFKGDDFGFTDVTTAVTD